MTVVTWPMFSANNGTVFFRVTWDSPLTHEDPSDPLGNTYIDDDPGATGLVHGVIYQNLSTRTWQLSTGSRVYQAVPGTPQTTLTLPTGQRFPYYESAYWEFRAI
jgi:hypothetical protein